MMRFKKQLALLLTFSMLFGLTAFSANVSFKEDTGCNYLKYVGGILYNGVSLSVEFRPDEDVTRAETAKMLSYVLSFDDITASGQQFNDVDTDHPSFEAIALLSSAEILNGYAGNLFKPENGLTRAEFSTILSRIMDIEPPAEITDVFTDIDGHWAANEITALCELEFINGYADNTFRPDRALTRAEAVKLINKAVNIEPDEDEARELYTDLPKSHWAYYDIMAATSLPRLDIVIDRGNVQFEDIEYIELNLDSLTRKCDTMLSEFDTAATARKAEIYHEFQKLKTDIETADTMTYINTQLDVKSEQYQKDKAALLLIQNMLTDKDLELYFKLMDETDNSLFDVLGIDKEDLERPSDPFDQEYIDLLSEETELTNEFNEFLYGTTIHTEKGVSYSLYDAQISSVDSIRGKAFDYYQKNYKKLGQIYDDLVDVRTRIADYFGFENYVDIGYLYTGKNYYTTEETDVFREDVKKYIVPLFEKIESAYDNPLSEYIYPDPEKIDSSRDMINETMELLYDMSPQTNQTLKYMQDYNMFDLLPRTNKSQTSFSIFIDEYLSPFMFMNKDGSYNDHSTFAHEFGHCLQFFRTYTEDYKPRLCYDTAEISSHCMELLMTNTYDCFFGEENARQYELQQLFNFIYVIISTCLAEEFQIKVYENPNMTIEQRNKLYIETRNEYFPEYGRNTAAVYKNGIIWDNSFHIYCVPFYAIDYALSLAAALQIWHTAKEDFDTAFEKYMNLVESPYSSYGIGMASVSAGLNSPFEEGVLEEIAEMLTELFKKDSTLNQNAA